jgi:ATP-dependent Clp protease adaptor protein ClpS
MQIISEVITLEPRKRAISGGDIGLDDMAQIVLYNDDVNSFGHVIKCLQCVFGHDQNMAEKITMDAHNNGRTVAEVESMSRSIRHKEQLISHGLTAEVERI